MRSGTDKLRKYSIFALLLTLFSPILILGLQGKIFDLSFLSKQFQKDKKVIYSRAIINKDFNTEKIEEGTIDLEKFVVYTNNTQQSGMSVTISILIGVCLLNLLFSLYFVNFPQILMSYIHKSDGKKDRRMCF